MTTTGLMDTVSLVFQDVHLVDAARRARVEPIVERLPDGWATRVGEGGRYARFWSEHERATGWRLTNK